MSENFAEQLLQRYLMKTEQHG